MEREPTAFVVDDDACVREGLSILLHSSGHHVETYPSSEAFLASYDPSWPGCLLADIRMPGLSGLELQAELRARNILLPVIIITGHVDVPMAVRAMKAGALDVIEKPFCSERVLGRVTQAIQMDAQIRRTQAILSEHDSRLSCLTPREQQILDCLAKGASSKRIAVQLDISVQAVATHRSKIIEKMETDNVVTLIRKLVTMQTLREQIDVEVE